MSVCSDCCTIELSNVTLTLGGTALLGGKASFAVRNYIYGLTLRAGANDPTAAIFNVLEATVPVPEVTASFITSHCESCSISPLVMNPATTIIVNSDFEPALSHSSVPCKELADRGICDRKAVCANKPSGGQQCSCPLGFGPPGPAGEIRCTDLCTLAATKHVYLEGSGTPLSSNRSVMSDTARLNFSEFVKSGSIDPSAATVWLWPKEGERSASLAYTADLVQTGSTRTGEYELQLRSRSEICTLVGTLDVRCTPGYSAADTEGMPCMPVANITAAGIRIKSSTGEVVFDGQLRAADLDLEEPRHYALAPINAGDQLTVEVTVHDIHGVLVSRSTLGLSMVLKGKTTSNKAPFKPPADGHVGFFVLTVPEMWIPEPDTIESAFQLRQSPVCTERFLFLVSNVSCALACAARRFRLLYMCRTAQNAISNPVDSRVLADH